MNAPVIFDAPRQVKLTLEDFIILDRAGALEHYRRAELIDGCITETSPLGMRHAIVCGALIVRLQQALLAIGSDHRALPAPTVAIPPHSAPEPDVVVSSGPISDDYADRRTVALVIEVSASTLRYDLTVKRDLYARGGLPEYWVVDVDGRQVHQFWIPEAGGYAETRTVPLAGELRSATLPDLAIDGGGIL